MPLPIVKPGIFDAIGAEMDNHDDFLDKLTTRLRERNSTLLTGFLEIAGSVGGEDEDSTFLIMIGGFFMYRLLESQAEADDLAAVIE